MLVRNRVPGEIECLIASLVLLFVLVSFVSASAEKELHPRTRWTGHALFREKGCIRCHSIYGKGGHEGPDLGERKFYGTYLELAATIWNHLPKMLDSMEKTNVEFPHLDGEEMEQIVVYLSYLRYRGEQGNERKGRSLLSKKGCVKCHSIESKEGDIGPDIFSSDKYYTPLMLIESMWNHLPEMTGVFEEQKVKWPKFQGNDIPNLASGIESYSRPTQAAIRNEEMGDPGKGEVLVKEKGCLHCHSSKNGAKRLGPSFGDLNFESSAPEIAGRMWNHSSEMRESMRNEGISFPVFEKGELADVITYVYSLQLEDEPGDPEKGGEIVQRRCLSCHTVNGQGAGISPDLAGLTEISSPLDMIAAMWNHAPKMREVHQDQDLKWPKFKGRDMAHVYAYFRNLSP